ncbi:MAG: hypothetical protein P1U82_28365, partial [Verrucomicrobiales bacterium]|nr:hypothetical protein [Verrucomicrobiales bacterium]
ESVRFRFTESAKEAVNLYFEPLFSLPDALRVFVDPKARISRRPLQRRMNELLSKAVCYNQGEWIQFAFLASEKHRDMKDELRKSSPNLHKLRKSTEGLLDYLNQTFHQVAQANFAILGDYFSARGRELPRICIKGYFADEGGKSVITVFRDRRVNYSSDVGLLENSGFNKVSEEGRYFLLNDIPSAARKGYRNQRLSPEKIEYYFSAAGRASRFFDLITGKKDESWVDCWDSGSRGPDPSASYKSTLIIPMTLWNNDLSDEFARKVNLPDVGRTILGFLCFDHIKKSYFLEEEDVKMGYIFADFLSIYLFTRIQYSEISSSFKESYDALCEKNITVSLRRATTKIEELARLVSSMSSLSHDIEKSSSNHLCNVDRGLVEFAKINYGEIEEEVSEAENPVSITD